MADVLEQARTAVARHQLALFDAGRINVVVVPPEDVRWLLTALRDRERETVVACAKAACGWCENEGPPMNKAAGIYWHGGARCVASRIWSRWPDYVPKAEAS